MFRPTFATGYAIEPGDSMFPELWDGLVGAWCPSMGKQGSNLFDFSPYKNHATLNNMDASTDYVPGKFGSALNYDGSNDHLDMGNIPQIDDASQDLTMIYWMRTSSAQTNHAMFTYDTNDSLSPSSDIYCMFKGNFTVGGFGDTGEWNTGYASSNFQDGSWHLIAVVLKGATKYVYRDGVVVASTSTPHNHGNYGSTHNFRVADNSNVGHYTGDIEDFFLYNRALRDDEILAIYSGASPLTPQPLNVPANSPAVTCQSGYTYRREITIDSTKVDSDLTDFPVLVVLSEPEFDFSKFETDFRDVRFFASDGVTPLSYELDEIVSGGDVYFWVKVPTVSSSSNTTFVMNYGNAGATDGTSPNDVWDSNHKMVLHLNESGDGTTDEFVDSTTNANHGTAVPTVTKVTGVVGSGQDFATSRITVDDDATLEAGTSDFTMSFKVKFDALGQYAMIGRATSGTSYFYFGSDGSNLRFRDYVSGNVIDLNIASPGFSTGVWYDLEVVRNGNDFEVFKDNVSIGTVTDASGLTDRSEGFQIGGNSVINYHLNGQMDEVRYSIGVDRGSAWRKARINGDDQTLISFGSEVECDPPLSQEESETIQLTENITTSVSLIKASFTEAISLSELTTKSLARAVQEFIDLTDNTQSAQAITLAIEENLNLTESVTKSLTKDIIESLDLTEGIDASPSDIETSVTEGISLTENITVAVAQIANNASRAIRINPLIFVTNTDPAKIVSVDISDPENPTHSVFTLTGASFAKDVAYNSVTGFLYVACADGIVVKVDSTSLSTQTLIDLSDTDDLQTIEVLQAFNITYTSTDSTTGELYLIDERETVLGDFRLDVLSTQSTLGDLQFDCIEGLTMDSDFTALSYVTTGSMNTDFKCLSEPIDDIEPIKLTDFVVKINGVQLSAFDVDLSTIVITHTIGEESTATFRLNRKHDQLDVDLESNSRQITNQNAVIVTIQGRTEFSGNISNISAEYNESEEFVNITATATEKTASYNTVNLSLPSLNSRLGLYDVMIQNPVIYNPVVDPNAEDPIRFKGIRASFGEKRVQSYSRYTFFDSFGSTATAIQNGTFVPRQNWTYFWGPTVRKFGDVELGDTVAFTFFYIGTSLSPVSEDLWVLTNAKHRRQRQYEDIVTELGNYEVGTAPFKEISTRNGVFIPKFHWVDESNGLYSIKDAGYDFTEYAKEVADLELQKLQNINGDILPETSCTIGLTIDGYYYHGLKLLTRLNIDNTTQSGIYKNNNGFPVSIKGITIDASTMKTSLQCDNLKSNAELEALDGLYPDEEDDRFNDDADRILIAGKTDMKTRLSVE